MALEVTERTRPIDLPRDKPQVDRTEQHANLDRRPGALLHPRARSWQQLAKPANWDAYRKVAAPGWR
ncbi:hypothetical protein JI739_13580 [Ramlibacter sp. AW1]|uniref:Uncharacterized protein n=1 Tax=Ramlibacter aurantiacus TaxID=2801330 RepID=A0A937D454_9BURK|nr:hypothetical protein [Ramlibacter aurantiacus]MBL0421385.1 hypothetical protein [Ramlibacter aurantiacus]